MAGKIHGARIGATAPAEGIAERLGVDGADPTMPGAACRSVDPELFFSTAAGDIEAARAVCGRCPVVVRCYDRFGHLSDGVVAGLTPPERRVLQDAELARMGVAS